MDNSFTPGVDSSSEITTMNSTVALQTTLMKSPDRQRVPAEVTATVGLIVSSTAVIANGVVLLVLVRARRQFGSTTHTLIVNQSAMDLYTSIFAIPIYILMLTHGFNYNGNPILDGAICVIFEGAALMIVGLKAEKVGLVVITLERYFKIVHTVAYRKYFRDWMTKVGVALPWIGGACLILIPAMCTTRIVNGLCLRTGVWPNDSMAMVCLYIFGIVFSSGKRKVEITLFSVALTLAIPKLNHNLNSNLPTDEKLAYGATNCPS